MVQACMRHVCSDKVCNEAWKEFMTSVASRQNHALESMPFSSIHEVYPCESYGKTHGAGNTSSFRSLWTFKVVIKMIENVLVHFFPSIQLVSKLLLGLPKRLRLKLRLLVRHDFARLCRMRESEHKSSVWYGTQSHFLLFLHGLSTKLCAGLYGLAPLAPNGQRSEVREVCIFVGSIFLLVRSIP